MADEWNIFDVAKAAGIPARLVDAVNDTTEALKVVYDESELNARDLYYLTVASAVRIALLSGAPKAHLRDAFERALNSLSELPS